MDLKIGNLHQVYILLIIKQLYWVMKNEIDKNLQLPPTHILYNDVGWISKKVDYTKLQQEELQAQNQQILSTLKTIETKLSLQLQQKKKLGLSKPIQTQNIKALDEKIKNNHKLIAALKNDVHSAEGRKGSISDGLESKTIDNKFLIERAINSLKVEIKGLKMEEYESVKILGQISDIQKPTNHDEHQRMERQLRVLSIKYVRLLDKYNKSTEKLALTSKIQFPEIDTPEDIYDKQLEQREEKQYKQYQGIVKLCTILSHRNDSEHNKAHREYTIKLKQLQRTIMKLGQLDQAITVREGELIESKKNIELLKVRITSSESVDTRAMRLSQGSILLNNRYKSYSTAKLQSPAQINKINQEKSITLKVRKRGYSLSKINAT